MSYTEFFEFKEHPFRITPDIEYFFASPNHAEALDSLKYFVNSDEGFLVLTGEPGTGKTITMRKFMNELPENVEYAYVMFPSLEPEEMFRAVLEDFGFPIGENQTKNALFSGFRDFLTEKKRQGKKPILIIDEAQNLPERTLEELRILSNLETEKEKLIRFVIAGQPELDAKLSSPGLRQLRQRITLHINLDYMNLNDMSKYVAFRLSKGGFHGQYPDNTFYKRLHAFTKGNPRLVNLAMERTLMSAYVDQSKILTIQHLQSAAASLKLETPEDTSKSKFFLYAGFALLAAIFVAGACFYYGSLYGKRQAEFLKHETPTVPKPAVQPEKKQTPLVRELPEEPKQTPKFGVVKASILNMRINPDITSQVMAKLPLNTRCEVLLERDGWLNIRVMLNGAETSGWVYGRNVETES
jgi:general secretion pathway protein A